MTVQEKTNTKNVIGLFKPNRNFNALFSDLQMKGYSHDDITVVMSQKTKESYFQDEVTPEIAASVTNKAPEGFTTGALTGGILGAIIGGLTLVGSVVIPGSQVLLLGPAVGAFTGAAAGAAAGGLVGALVGAGVPEVEAKFYNDAIDKGENVLVVVNAVKGDEHEIEEVFKRYDAEKTNVS